MRFITALLLLALAPIPVLAQSGPESLQAEMVERFRKAMPEATVTPKPGDPLAIIFTGGGWEDGAQINLDRIYAYCSNASAQDCETEKTRFLAGISKKPESPTPASFRLVVRDQAYVDSLRSLFAQNPNGKPDDPVFEPLGGGLFALLVADSPDALQIMPSGALEDMGLTRSQAWALAKRQTQPLLPTFPTADQLNGPPVLYDDHEFGGSLLIDLPGWAKLAAEAGPSLFVAVISDRFVFVGIMPDGPDLNSFMKSIEEDCLAQPRCTSPHVYRFRNGRWAVAE